MPAMARRRRTPIRIPLSMLLLLLLLAVSAASAAAGDQDARGADRRVLLEFKSAVSADPAGLLTRWVGPDHCLWLGVSCAAARVVSLNLSAAAPCASLRLRCPDARLRLSGTLTPALAELSKLRSLSLPFHRFDGEIPREIWGMRSLEALDLEGCSLSGTLPSQFPVRLAALNLAGNRIAGEVPNSLSTCMDLSILDLSGNRLNGTIPSFLGDFRNLSRLDLSGNLLVGGIPSNIGNCSQLQSLLLFSNMLDGEIPSELGWLAKLQVLDLSRNSLSGPIPAELGNCFELAVLVLLNLYDPLPHKDELSYEGGDELNYFEGGFPQNVALLPNLRLLWAPRAMLEGEIPINWGACKSLEMVNFGENLFTGHVPFGRCKNLRFLNLSSNRLSGWLDGEHMVPCMDVFDISGNLLSGSIPRFLHRGCPEHWFLQDDVAYAYYSFFANRSWVATPFSGFASSAVYHDFGRNNFSGALPSFSVAKGRYGNRSVYVFIADGNYLVGSLTDFPFNRCKDSNGLIANLSNNLISGGIPAEIGNICNGLIVLDVAGNRIAGDIPQSFGLLGDLVGLDLSRNRLQGEIPINFKELKGLEYLLLAGNNLSGQIPTGLVQLHSLKLLDLSSNYLRGEIPDGLVYLTNLTTLLLNDNNLSGKIPSGISNATSLSTFNVSFNNLSGPLPLNASMMRCDSFLGNPLLQSCRAFSLSIPPSYMEGISGDSQTNAGDSPPGSPPSNNGKSGFSSIEIASITSAAAIISVLVALIIIYIYTRKCDPRSSSRSPGRREVTIFVDIGVPLTYESVVRATGGFNGSNCIGNGGFGATYKAEVSPGVVVAIKRLSIGRFHGIQQFHAEIKTLGRWRHPNLVTLIGYHLSDAEMFLIYNYLPGGNLERFIKERPRRAIDWRMLHKIALDVARALAYLHDHCVPRILHRDVKPSNILLDNDYNAYLSDFGLARLMGNSETHATTGVAGTFGYVAPEYALTCRVSDKADVYSYGVVLLELISDKKALDPSFSPYGHGFNIVTWASVLLREGRATEFFNQDLWDGGPHDDLVEALNLAIQCTHESLSARPTMRQVIRRLKELQPPTF